MAASHLRRWWGSRRLLPFAAGLTLLAMTVSAGSDISTAVTPGPSVAATITVASAPGPHVVPGAPATDLETAVRSAKPDGCAAGVTTNHDRRADVAACSVLCDEPCLDGSARRATAPTDALPPLGVAHAPLAPRAPPLRRA